MPDGDAIADAIAGSLESPTIGREKGNALVRVVTGRLRGVSVRFHVEADARRLFWWVESKGASPPLLLRVSRRGLGERGGAHAGATGEVSTKDAAFDADFRVEGAPADTARRIVDDAVRAALVRAGKVDLEVDEGRVTVSLDSAAFRVGFPDGSEALATLEAAVVVRERLSELAGEKIDEATRARARQEIAALRAEQDKLFARLSWPQKLLVLALGAALVLALLAYLWGNLPH